MTQSVYRRGTGFALEPDVLGTSLLAVGPPVRERRSVWYGRWLNRCVLRRSPGCCGRIRGGGCLGARAG